MFYYTAVLLIPCSVMAQSVPDLKVQERKKFIDKVEVFGGPSLWIPNDHGWAEYQTKSSDHQMISKFQSEAGYQFGLGFTHVINKKFEIQGRVSKVRVHYSERETFFDVYGQLTSVWTFNQKNDQIVLSLLPSYFFSDKNRLHVFGGLSYSFLTRSVQYVSSSTGGYGSAKTINGFEKHVINALLGVGYSYPISKRIAANLRVQGEYGLSDTLNENKERISVNGISTSIGLRYSMQ
jgi:hypothetical protein